MKPPRILIGATLLGKGQGGIACVARMTARALQESGADVELLSLLDRAPVALGGTQSRAAGGSRLRYAFMCHNAARHVDYALYDSVGMARAHPGYGRLRRRYAVWMHGIEAWYDLRPARRKALLGANLVLVNSQFTLDKFHQLHGLLPQARICALATEEDDEPRERPLFDGPPKVLCLGRIDAEQMYKGHRELINAWPAVVATVPNARLVLAGGGTGLEAIRSLAQASSAASMIDVLGFVPEADLPALWRSAHVFAMPSRNEGFGLVYIEAMRHGLPVIASRHDAGSEVNVDGVTGYNVSLDAGRDLQERLIGLLGDPDTAQGMGRAGFQHWRERFRYRAFTARLLDCLDSALHPVTQMKTHPPSPVPGPFACDESMRRAPSSQ